MHAVRCFGPEGFIFPAAEGIAGWLPWAASPLWESPTVHSQGSSQPVTGGRWGIRAWPPCSKQTLQKAILVSEITKRSAEAFAVQPNFSLFLLPPQDPGVFIERVSLPENFLHPHLHLSAGFPGPDMEQSANMKSWLALVLIREMRIIGGKKKNKQKNKGPLLLVGLAIYFKDWSYPGVGKEHFRIQLESKLVNHFGKQLAVTYPFHL